MKRILLSMLHDGLMAAASLVVALWLRVGGTIVEYDRVAIAQDAALFAAIMLVMLRVSGLYRGIWRYASLEDLFGIARAATISILVYTLALFWLTRLEGVPRSALMIQWFVLILFLSGPRIAYRLFKDGRIDRIFERASARRVPVLLVGAGDEAELFVREMRRDPHANYEAVGILGRNATRVGRAIHGVRILGTVDQLDQMVERLAATRRPPQRLIITEPNLPAETLRRIVEQATQLGLTPGRMPRVTEIGSGLDEAFPIRPIAIEDLLQRPQRVLDRASMAALIAGRRVLVTGAGGTIGSELARQIAALGPRHLTLLDNAEYGLYLTDLDLAERFATLERASLLGDIRDRRRLDEVLAEYPADLVFHAAAYKHVPMVEANPLEALLTNVVGTRNLAEACRAGGVGAMVMISTDKAVNPSNVMGATKRLAELVCQSLDLLNQTTGRATRYITVRFGNVLGSTGSVVPLFRRQLEAGGPLTVTDPEVTRFFMTVAEAVELVLQAAAASVGSNSARPRGGVYVLEMGEPVRDRGSREADDPVGRAGTRARHPDRVHRTEARRETARGAIPRCRDTGPDRHGRRAACEPACRRLCGAGARPRRTRGRGTYAPRNAGTGCAAAAGARVRSRLGAGRCDPCTGVTTPLPERGHLAMTLGASMGTRAERLSL